MTWKEFWTWFTTVPEAKKPYWVPMVKNNSYHIAKDLGIKVYPDLMNEEEARTLYLRWCQKTDVPATKTQLVPNAMVTPWPEMNARLGSWQTPSMALGTQCEYGKKLWVYNVSRVDHQFDHPMLGNVTIPANTTRKRYSLWTSFPEYVMGTNYNIDTKEMYTYPIKGEYFVNDLINPDNILGCKTVIGRTTIGRDLSVKGVFWSYSNPPKGFEVAVAIEKMKARYVDLLERIAIIYEASAINAGNVEQEMKRYKIGATEAVQRLRAGNISRELSPEHHAAAEYLKVTTPWHPVLKG